MYWWIVCGFDIWVCWMIGCCILCLWVMIILYEHWSLFFFQVFFYSAGIYRNAGVPPDAIQYAIIVTNAINVIMTIVAVIIGISSFYNNLIIYMYTCIVFTFWQFPVQIFHVRVYSCYFEFKKYFSRRIADCWDIFSRYLLWTRRVVGPFFCILWLWWLSFWLSLQWHSLYRYWLHWNRLNFISAVRMCSDIWILVILLFSIYQWFLHINNF